MGAIRWRIYYLDGSTFSDQDGAPFDASGYGLQVIAQWGADGVKRLVHKRDHYWWTPAGWEGGDIWGYMQSLRRPGPQKHVLGESCGDYDAILKRAIEE